MVRRARSGFGERRSGPLNGHPNNPVPLTVGPHLSISAILHDPVNGIYDEDIAVGLVPDQPFPYAWAITRIWYILGADESGTGELNLTSLIFGSGEDASLAATIATMTTAGDPAAGEPVTQALRARVVESGMVLLVSPTRTGVGSVDFDLERITVGFDLVGIRVG